MSVSPVVSPLMQRLLVILTAVTVVSLADDRRPIRLSYQVVEQQPPGTFVANVALDAARDHV